MASKKSLWERERIDPCKDCLRPVVEAGAGATLGELNYRLYSLFIGQIDAHPQLRLGYRLQPGVEIGGLSKIGDKIKIRVFTKGYKNLVSRYTLRNGSLIRVLI